jgi:hypothetical protein
MLKHATVRKCLRLKAVHLAQDIRLPPRTQHYGEDDRTGGRGTADTSLAVNENSALVRLDLLGKTNQAFNILLRGTAI